MNRQPRPPCDSWRLYQHPSVRIMWGSYVTNWRSTKSLNMCYGLGQLSVWLQTNGQGFGDTQGGRGLEKHWWGKNGPNGQSSEKCTCVQEPVCRNLCARTKGLKWECIYLWAQGLVWKGSQESGGKKLKIWTQGIHSDLHSRKLVFFRWY